jgi:hypothetical protein
MTPDLANGYERVAAELLAGLGRAPPTVAAFRKKRKAKR